MPKFKLKLDHPPVDLYRPAGHFDSFKVEPGDVVDVPGELVTSRPAPKKDEAPLPPLPDDAYIVAGADGEEQAWPHTVWELVTNDPAPVTAAPAVAAPAAEEA